VRPVGRRPAVVEEPGSRESGHPGARQTLAPRASGRPEHPVDNPWSVIARARSGSPATRRCLAAVSGRASGYSRTLAAVRR